jgi:YD repeat-containing protein
LRHSFLKILVASLLLLPTYLVADLPARAQQGATTSYVYDEDGRLHAVISPTGEAAVYDYDAAGNFAGIRRLTSNELELLTFTPRQGPVGTPVTIYGTGFNQGVNSVSFNGVAANIVRSNIASVVALVPQGATTGPITVVTPRGAATSIAQFVVRGVLLTPQAASIPASDSIQFGLSISGTPTSDVVWSVNGADGGGLGIGTITSDGFYTAPNLAGSNTVQHHVRATSVDDPTLFGESVVTVVPFGVGVQFRSDGLSVRYGTPPNSPPTYVNGAVSVRYGTPPNNPPTYVNGAVSVRYGTPANSPPAYVNGAVSVRYGTPANQPPTEITGAVSVSRGPVFTSLTLGTFARGTTVTLTVNGIALNGASSVSFYKLTNGVRESGITVSNIIVNSQGTSLSATIAVAGSVATGRYLVVISTPAGSTVRNDVGSNAIQIN